jgi:hypothetical protein
LPLNANSIDKRSGISLVMEVKHCLARQHRLVVGNSLISEALSCRADSIDMSSAFPSWQR